MTVYTEPVFEEPSLEPRKGKYQKVLEPLVEKKGKWGRIGEYKNDDSAYQAALNLQSGKYNILGEPDDWEFASDGNAVYARFVGQSKK